MSLPFATTPAGIVGAVQFDMPSAITGRTYRVFVYQPPGGLPEGGFPVVTVTDGNLTFPIAAAMSSTFISSDRKAALVVGVGYPAEDLLTPYRMRTRDLTPPTPLSGIRAVPGLPPPRAEDYGGGHDFLRFLTEELRPVIAASYPVNPADETLYGHSLGGLFVLDALFRQPGLYRSFAASSPSIWWNGRAVLGGEAGFASALRAGAAPRVLITVGATEQEPGLHTPPNLSREEMAKLLVEARMVDNARELAGRLAAIKGGDGYAVRFQCFEAEDHMTVVAAALSRTLAFALRP